MQSTGNLAVSRHARIVAREVYRVTQAFPAHERFGLTAQMRRAAVSVGSNIAEGCGRHGDRELVAFLQIAMGSASELRFQVELATELGFTSAESAEYLCNELNRLMRMLSRLIVSIRKALAQSTPRTESKTIRLSD
jgi:four helix bundle protein